MNPDGLRSFSYSPEYDVVFTLMNSQPDAVKWNIKNSVNSWYEIALEQVQPFLEGINVKLL